MAKTNPKGPGTETFSVNMPKETVSRLRHLAAKSDVSLSRYCKRILTEAAERDQIFSITGTTLITENREKKPDADAVSNSTDSTANLTESTSRAIRPAKQSTGGATRQ